MYSTASISNENNSMLVRDSYEFYGLASYLNEVKRYSINIEGDLQAIREPVITNEMPSMWLAWTGRFNVLLYEIDPENENNSINRQLVTKDKLRSFSPSLDSLRYAHLWYPLASLTKFVEWVLSLIYSMIQNWGWTIVFYAVVIKIVLFPIGKMTARLQKEVGLINKRLLPTLADIKSSYDGEEAHKMIMQAHKELGVGPFYSLKPLLATFIQIPLLIATFNALAEMPQLDSNSFLWIDNLAYPDEISYFPVAVPFLGNSFNLLPILMTLVSLFAAYSYTNNYDSTRLIKKQQRNLYLMAFCFLILFYPFPAAMVLYWMSSNIFHLVQQKIMT